MRCGTAMCGTSLPLLGAVRNLSVSPIGYDGVALAWTLDQVQDVDALVAVYCDGVLQALVPTDTTVASVAALSSGTHTLTAIPVSQTPPQRMWNLSAQRVWLRWQPSTVPDLAAYVVQQQAGSDWQTMAIITRLSVAELVQALPAGTGTGKLSVFGALNTSEISGQVQLVYNATSNKLELWHDSVKIDEQALVPYATLVFAYGLRVYVHDGSNSYVDGDTWTTTAGIATNWQSEPLTGGRYVYRVLAQDVTGNTSTQGTRTVSIQSLPQAVDEPSWTVVDNGDDTFDVTVGTTLPTDGSKAYLYSNLNRVFGSLEESINTRAPLCELGASTVLVKVPKGTFKAYVWTSKNGVARDDMNMYELALPPTAAEQGIELSEVLGLKLSCQSTGVVSAAFLYDVEAGPDYAGFDVLFQTTEVPNWSNAISIASSEDITTQSGSLVGYSVPSTVTFSTGETVYCWIRSTDGLSHYGDVAASSLAVDITPPPAPVMDLCMPA